MMIASKRELATGVAALFLCGASLAACGRGDRSEAEATAAATAMAEPGGITPAPPITDTAPATSALADPGIAFIAVTANSIDSSFGVMAEPKASNPEVRAFARRMREDHGAVNREAVALVTRLNVTPTDNDVARGLQAGANASRDSLAGLQGAAFDSAYMAREVAYHAAVLDAIDQTLVPGAQNPELRALLVKVRPNVAAHLDLARNVQGKLAKP